MLPTDTRQVAKVPPMTSREARGLRPKGGSGRKILVILESHTDLSQEHRDQGAPGHGANDWPVKAITPPPMALTSQLWQALQPAFTL